MKKWRVYGMDMLLWVLLGGPLLFGGYRWHTGSLKLEWSQTLIPTLVMWGLLWGFGFRTRSSLKQLSFFRAGEYLWNQWCTALSQHPRKALAWGCFATGCFYSAVSIYRHWMFQSAAEDLGIFFNTLWNLTHGYGYQTALKGGINLFLDHQSPILWAFAPLVKLWPRPEGLLLAQGFLIPVAGPALWVLAKRYRSLPAWVAPALPLLFWSSYLIRNLNRFDFHPEFLMIPAFLWALAFLEARKLWASAACFFLGLLCKESAAPVLTGVGLAILAGAVPDFSRRERAVLGATSFIVGVLVFFGTLAWVGTHAPRGHAYLGLYAHLGSGPLEIILSPFLRPAAFFSSIFTPERARFFFWSVAPLGFLPLFGWRRAIAALPAFMMLFLAQGTTRVGIEFQYFIEPSIGLFWAFPMGVRWICEHGPAAWKRGRLGLWVLFWAIAGFGRNDLFYARSYVLNPIDRRAREELFPCMRRDVAWVVPYAWVSQLSDRPWIHHDVNSMAQWTRNSGLRLCTANRSEGTLSESCSQCVRP